MQWAYFAVLIYVSSLGFIAFLLFSALRRAVSGWQRRIFMILGVLLLLWLFLDALTRLFLYLRWPHVYLSTGKELIPHAAVFVFYLFCEVFPGNRLPLLARRRALVLGIFTVPVACLVFLPGWASNHRLGSADMLRDLGPLFYVSAGWLSFLALLGLYLAISRARRLNETLYRVQTRFFLGGAVACVITVLLFAVLSPLFGVEQYQYLGNSVSFVLLALTIYAILIHRMSELRSSALRVGLDLLTGLAVAFAVDFIFAVLVPDRLGGAFSRGSVLLTALIFVAGLLFGRKLQPRIDNLLFGPPVRYEDMVIEMFHHQETSGPETPLELHLTEILEGLRGGLHFQRAFIAVPGGPESVRTHCIGAPPASLRWKKNRFLLRLHRRLMPEGFQEAVPIVLLEDRHFRDALRSRRKWVSRAPRLLREFDRTLRASRKDGYRLFVPLIAQRRLAGYLILGPRTDGFPYTNSDLRLLDALRVSVALTIRNRIYKEEAERSREAAESEVEALARVISSRETISFELGEKTLLYRSEAMAEVMDFVRDAVRMEHPVLVTGETGTGKELIARLIHTRGDAPERPFVAVNCASIPQSLWEDELFGHVRGAFTDARKDRPGRIQEAGEGALFLDEVGEMPLEMQAKLLRVLQERVYTPLGDDRARPVGCRFIFATNRDLQAMVAAGTFREDLFFRINVFPVHLPPLRERREDIPILAEHLLRKYAQELKAPVADFDADALATLQLYSWPGNIRELENVIIRAVAMVTRSAPGDGEQAALIGRDALPLSLRESKTNEGQVVWPKSPGAPAVRRKSGERDQIPIPLAGDFEELVNTYRRLLIENALKRAGGNRTRAAALLGIKRGRLLYQMNELRIV